MIKSELSEIYFSIISALVFGLIFSAFLYFFTFLRAIVRGLALGFQSLSSKEAALPLFKEKCPDFLKKRGSISQFLYILLLSVGFSVLSYYSLDGQIRIYMVIVYSASIFMSNNVFFRISKMVLPFILSLIFTPLRKSVKVIRSIFEKFALKNKRKPRTKIK